ncbi:MAG TPA: HAD-IA family hydrolase [Candidatus Pullichristensenella stercorigallinarum]|uniref:HAD-IA family hydrolase n=1 Tax=Candidatus Pullichristensenella stercorigallinarum TaxID=2840909 RepID=A0A9D0ZQ44_9FIRM|nr:HAD-IA family hydrolase [Candidatus Pullichristensenella stercorigallinarum]
MKYTCAIFDLDGTLLNTLDDLKNAVNAALAKRGYPARTLDEVRLFVGNGVARLIERAVPEGTSAAETAAILADFRDYYNAHINVETHPYAGVAALLGKLRAAGVKIGVNSNKYDAAVQLLMNDHFPGLFDKAVGESETVPKKPSPIGVETLLKALDADAESAVYIGDSGVDEQTAKNAGLPFIWVSWGFRRKEELPDLPEVRADDASELETLLLG